MALFLYAQFIAAVYVNMHDMQVTCATFMLLAVHVGCGGGHRNAGFKGETLPFHSTPQSLPSSSLSQGGQGATGQKGEPGLFGEQGTPGMKVYVQARNFGKMTFFFLRVGEFREF